MCVRKDRLSDGVHHHLTNRHGFHHHWNGCRPMIRCYKSYRCCVSFRCYRSYRYCVSFRCYRSCLNYCVSHYRNQCLMSVKRRYYCERSHR